MSQEAERKLTKTMDLYLEEDELLHAFELEEIASRRTRSSRPARHFGKTIPAAKVEISSDLTGLALSGGGVRSAATCLGAIQAMHVHGRLNGFDYLSTVSGGGYIGATLSAALAELGGKKYPFGEDASDSPVLSHLRNFSNYLMPRSRSLAINLADGGVILIRGLIANAICVLAFLLPIALASAWLFQKTQPVGGLLKFLFPAGGWLCLLLSYLSFDLFLVLLLLLCVWAAIRVFPNFDRVTGDTNSPLLKFSRALFIAAPILLFLELQPAAVSYVERLPNLIRNAWVALTVALPTAGGIAGFASTLGNFLKHSKHRSGRSTRVRRGLAKAVLYLGSAIVPLLLWLSYLVLTARLMTDVTLWGSIIGLFGASFFLIWFMAPNSYSLHGFYRDRLSAAFLAKDAGNSVKPLKPKLSDLQDSTGPYPLINAALNIQGSAEANQRGREADFFVFTPHYAGSSLTGYAALKGDREDGAGFETADPRLDLGCAIATSGAAVSANMGSHTVRALSPTLSLLNVRLGYWIRNPKKVLPPKNLLHLVWRGFWDRAFLLKEMLNRADETSRLLYLTDGGHVENLGIYQLLKRRCGLIFAIDAEADPEWSCSSLLKLERYARIDLGARIELPWEEIAIKSADTSHEIQTGFAKCRHGPHCAVGPIYYRDGTKGVLIYIKSSLTGDEKDYVLDYARRNPMFPHEPTSDQFFSEEQFEMYRALGFHMVSRFFSGDEVSVFKGPDDEGLDSTTLRGMIDDLLPPIGGSST